MGTGNVYGLFYWSISIIITLSGCVCINFVVNLRRFTLIAHHKLSRKNEKMLKIVQIRQNWPKVAYNWWKLSLNSTGMRAQLFSKLVPTLFNLVRLSTIVIQFGRFSETLFTSGCVSLGNFGISWNYWSAIY